MSNKTSLNYNSAITQEKKQNKKKEDKFIFVNHFRLEKNIKSKIIEWLLTDVGDNLIILDFLLISFENMNRLLTNRELKTSKKEFFTYYVNWIYFNSCCD